MDKKTGIFLGVDLGGTNVRVGAFQKDGKLLAWQADELLAIQGPQAGLGKIYGLIADVAARVNLAVLGIGIGSTGPIDRMRGTIQNPYTLPGWEDVDIVSPLLEKYSVPVAFENDADAAALGETWVGAGRGARRVMMVTFGTGIGTGFVLNGKIYRGLGDEHPEGGHILIDPSGPPCYCGANGCWESLASGPAITKYAQQLVLQPDGFLYRQSGANSQNINTAMIFAGEVAGDRVCAEIVDRAARHIGLGLVSLMMVTLPDCVVLGGGVMRSYGRMQGRIKEIVQRHNVIIPTGQVRLEMAALGQQAGIYGAARAAMNKCEEPV
jgi:glucokinase